MLDSTDVQLTLASDLNEINRASREIENFCVQHDVSLSQRRVLELVVEELVTNTVQHGKQGRDSTILVRLDCDESTISLDYRDSGAAFDPRQDLPPDVRGLPLEQRPVGGLGWALILHYCRLESCHYIDGENHYLFSIERMRSC